MNYKLFILTILLGIPVLYADAQSIERSVIASAGSFSSAGGMQISSTIGELRVSTIGSGAIVLNQGFQQGSTLTTSTLEYDFENLNVIVFPNPTLAEITIQLKGSENSRVNYTVYDISGKLIQSGLINTINGTVRHMLDFQKLSGGDYFLNLIDINTERQETIKILKM